MKNKITPDQYVQTTIVNFPTLYAGPDYKICKLKVLDQLLNVAGNGIRDDEELLEHFDLEPAPEYSQRYHNEVIFRGYYTEDWSDRNVIYCLDKDRYKYPNIVRWLPSAAHGFNPYPNFQEEYSVVYRCPKILKFGQDWVDEIIKFYEYCRKWILENEGRYHYGFPKETADATKRSIESLRSFISKYKSHEEISDAYECEYDGDIYKFQCDRWQKEKQRILKFIDKTLKFLRK